MCPKNRSVEYREKVGGEYRTNMEKSLLKGEKVCKEGVLKCVLDGDGLGMVS